MLNRLKLENFKAWREADLEFGRVTGIFGATSAGKSSLLQLLLLLKQTSNATDRGVVLDLGGPADLVSLGTFKDVIHRHDDQDAMSWLLDWTLPEKLEIHDPNGPPGTTLFEGDRLETRCQVGLRQERMWAQEHRRQGPCVERIAAAGACMSSIAEYVTSWAAIRDVLLRR